MNVRHILSFLLLVTFNLEVIAQEEEEGDNCIDASVEYPIDTSNYRSWTEYSVDSNFAAELFTVESHQPACARVADTVRQAISYYAEHYQAQFEPGEPCAEDPDASWCFWEADIGMKAHYLGERIESFLIHEWAYTGGAHGNYQAIGLNFVDGKAVELSDIIKSDMMSMLERLVIKELQRQNAPDVMGEDATLDLTKYDFVIDPKGIEFKFSPYEVGPYVSGPFCARVLWSDAEGMLKVEFLLQR